MPNDTHTYEITTDCVERATGAVAPYYTGGRTKEKPSVFALCPHCENPIQIYGLYEAGENYTPHGKHTGGNQKGFPPFDPDAQRRCPYVKENLRKGDTQLAGSDFDRRILIFVRENFDRIVKVMEFTLGIGISGNAAVAMLGAWLEAKGYRYSRVSLGNVPFMLLYGVQSTSVYGQEILSSEVRQKISDAIRSADFDEKHKLTRKPGGKFFSPTIQCLEHKYQPAGHSVEESFNIRIFDAESPERNGTPKAIWEERKMFDFERMNAIMGDPNFPRNKYLLGIANKLIG